MEDSRKKAFRAFAFPVSKTAFSVVLLAVVAAVAVAALIMPGTASNSVVAAQESADVASAPEQVTPEMLSYALNFRTASNYTVFADRGISDRGNSQIRGNSGDALRDEGGVLAGKELSRTIDALMQLPCREVAGSDLTNKRFEPGVYCLPSADLAGSMTLDAQNDRSGVFIFRVNGTINTRSGSEVVLENGAIAGNVFFVTRDRTVIGDNTILRGNVISSSDIAVGSGSTIGSKVLSLGKVELNENNIGGGTGTLEICKAITPSTVDISNRIFNFTISGVAGTIAVPVGSCSGPIDVPAGTQTITELNTGQTITGGTFTGNFQLIDVRPITTQSTSTMGQVNLATRTVSVNVVEGGVAEQLTLRFTNQYAITGYVEICKYPASGLPTGPTAPAALPEGNGTPGPDPDVTGFFQYTIEGVYAQNLQNPTVRVLQVFTVPVGQCTGAIAVTISNPLPTGNPRESTVRVTELGRAGYFLESVSTIPVNREVGQEVLGSGVNANGGIFANPGGGYVTVRVIEGSPATETMINFFNRTNPGLVKVCKIAGPGIPNNVIFRFVVRGFGPTNASAPQTATYGPVERIVDVRAGSPASGGNCAFVPGFGGGAGMAEFQTFVVGTPVLTWETGISPLNDVPFTVPTGGSIRVSRIRTSSDFAGAFSPDPDLEPGTTPFAYIARASIVARRDVVEIDYTNFVFRPTILKVCKIAGTAAIEGRPFTFDVALVSPTGPGNDPLFPAFTTSVTVNAGPASQGGFCAVVDGSGLLGGAFNIGQTYTITERASAGTVVTAITSPSSTVGVDLPNRRATLSGTGGMVAGVTQVAFTNGPGAAVSGGTLYDFDGDRRADLSIFRPSDGTWWYSASGSGGQYRAQAFGVATDRPVAADYDGDGITDLAVYRGGQWHVLGSATGYRVDAFGLPDDIPQMGDFDGDGKADRAVYRPSTGTWYILRSTDGGFYGFPFGLPTDKPVAADYDGDGRMDPAVYRDGTWYMLRSRDGFAAVQFGLPSDRLVPGDYDGDRRVDQAVYRDGTWYILRSTDNGVRVDFLGTGTDVPVVADYDGDGRIDLGVFTPSTGRWDIRRSTESSVNLVFGFGTDLPIPARR